MMLAYIPSVIEGWNGDQSTYMYIVNYSMIMQLTVLLEQHSE